MTYRSHAYRSHSAAAAMAGDNGHTARAMADYYNFPPIPPSAPTIAIVSLGGSYKMADLQAYWRLQGIPGTPNVTAISVGDSTSKPEQHFVPGDGSEENTLDLEIATSICPTARFIVYFGSNTRDGFYRAIHAAVNGPATIISISWGSPEDAFGGPIGLGAFEQLFRQAQNAGKIVVAAAGDAGNADGTYQIVTDYPSCSPSVIACGGTSLLANGQETAWSWNPTKKWGTGGGISKYFPTPSYQRGIVGPYQGRASPDLSLLADPANGWSIYYNGSLGINGWGGTSAVAPAIAGLLACYNLKSYASFHQQIYNISNSTAFNDIVVGSNASVAKDRALYSAKKGYDLATGLGSVHGVTLRAALVGGSA